MSILLAASAPPQLDGSTPQAIYAYERIREKLIMLEIKPGDPINDADLADELLIGKTPIREALKRLETDHLVVSYPRRGTFATVVNASELRSISDIRRVLEPLGARRAAENATIPMRAKMLAVAEEIRHLDLTYDDTAAFLRTDIAVHGLIYQATNNSILEDALIRYDNLAVRIWCLVIDHLPAATEHIREHIPLLGAIADGKADEAAQRTLDNVISFEEAIGRYL